MVFIIVAITSGFAFVYIGVTFLFFLGFKIFNNLIDEEASLKEKEDHLTKYLFQNLFCRSFAEIQL